MQRFWSSTLAVTVLLGACSNGGGESDVFDRPVAEPGKIATVIDEKTPKLVAKSVLRDLAVDREGTLYLAYTGPGEGYRIIAVPVRGTPEVLADDKERAFPKPNEASPVSLALDAEAKTLYVADAYSGWIRAIDRDGKLQNVAKVAHGRLEEFDLDAPLSGSLQSLQFDPGSKTLYVTDGCRVARVQGDVPVAVAGAGCELPDPSAGRPPFGEGVPALEGVILEMGGFAVDPANGDLVIAAAATGNTTWTIFRVDSQGQVNTVITPEQTPAGTEEDLSQRRRIGGDLAFDPRSLQLIVADPVLSTIRSMSVDGTAATLAGTGTVRATGDGGAARLAGLDGPSRIAVDSEGNIYVNGQLAGVTVRMIGATN